MQRITGWITGLGILELSVIVLILINSLAFFLYTADKRKAVNNKRRINENTLIFFTLAFGGIGAFFGMRVAGHKTKSKKFRLAAAIGIVVALIPVIHIAHGYTLDKIIRYAEIEYKSENWPAELDGYRIAFMTDFHIITDSEMRGVAEELNGRDIDLLLLGGDFYMYTAHYRGTLREIAQVRTKDGIYGVEGNHDDHVRLFAVMEENGITPLYNSGVQIYKNLYLAGVCDMWNDAPNIEEAVSTARGDGFVLLLSHNPDMAMEQTADKVDLMFSGHTHGGHITFFGYPAYLLLGSITSFGTRFGYGFAYSPDGPPVYTSSGVGSYRNIPRVFARPEVVIFTMYHC